MGVIGMSIYKKYLCFVLSLIMANESQSAMRRIVPEFTRQMSSRVSAIATVARKISVIPQNKKNASDCGNNHEKKKKLWTGSKIGLGMAGLGVAGGLFLSKNDSHNYYEFCYFIRDLERNTYLEFFGSFKKFPEELQRKILLSVIRFRCKSFLDEIIQDSYKDKEGLVAPSCIVSIIENGSQDYQQQIISAIASWPDERIVDYLFLRLSARLKKEIIHHVILYKNIKVLKNLKCFVDDRCCDYKTFESAVYEEQDIILQSILQDYRDIPESVKTFMKKIAFQKRDFYFLKKVDPEFSIITETFVNKVTTDDALSECEKLQLINILKKFNWNDIINNKSIKSIDQITKQEIASLSKEILNKYMQVVLYAIEQKERKELSDKGFDRTELEESLTDVLSQKLIDLSKFKNPAKIYKLLLCEMLNFIEPLEYPNTYIENKDDLALISVKLKALGMVSKIKTFESQMNGIGYETFYHGRLWEWNFINDVWNMICAVKNNQSICEDKISLRYRDNANISQLLNFRKELMNEGSLIGSCTAKKLKDSSAAEVTFMNKTSVSNSTAPWESSGSYFFENHSCSHIDGPLDELARLRYESGLLNIFDDEFQKLYELHKASNPERGELLCISVKKENVDELVYHSADHGVAESDHFPASKHIDNFKRSFSSPLYIDSDESYFCLAVSDIPGENDEKNGKYFIKSFNLADPVKYKEYLKARDELLQKMLNAKKY